MDNVDVPAATRRGIVVMNTPAGNSISAAEHTMGLLLALMRRIPQADSSIKQGKWERQRFIGTELDEKVLGVIGYGKIGIEVVKRAQSFRMRVLVFDPYVSDALARDHNLRMVSSGGASGGIGHRDTALPVDSQRPESSSTPARLP